jgi:hypothetical protein
VIASFSGLVEKYFLDFSRRLERQPMRGKK